MHFSRFQYYGMAKFFSPLFRQHIYFDDVLVRKCCNIRIINLSHTHTCTPPPHVFSFLFLLLLPHFLHFQAAYTDLEQVAWDLKTAQMEAGVDFPVHLSREAGGLVRSDTGLLRGDSAEILFLRFHHINCVIGYEEKKKSGKNHNK